MFYKYISSRRDALPNISKIHPNFVSFMSHNFLLFSLARTQLENCTDCYSPTKSHINKAILIENKKQSIHTPHSW